MMSLTSSVPPKSIDTVDVGCEPAGALFGLVENALIVSGDASDRAGKKRTISRAANVATAARTGTPADLV